MQDLTGKVALVTGAARGQGRSHATFLAEAGADVIVLDICRQIETVPYPTATAEDLDETVALVEKYDRRAYRIECDVRDPAALTNSLDKAVVDLGRLDIAVLNAGVCEITPAESITPEQWNTVIGTNLSGAFFAAQAAMKHIVGGKRGGSMVFVGSASTLTPVESMVHYIASKHGVVGVAKALAKELARHQIRVNVVHPTNCDTPMIQNSMIYDLFAPDVDQPNRDSVEPVFKTLAALDTPWVDPADISRAVLYLVGESGRYVTGTQLEITAGYPLL
ncbi:mycofactocin-coupled SDR family oxidoreductase [Rhodococcus erythropolis]|uniref:mycofactocin-coupled SDR family oxidoreductase n=1 Tax=Rhodococcus erythropolis TaxID=1833 RepID=UPI00294A063B|nr:mycofactocin-coupled SDR family oxidoreductase [Rhodococcus erythropolis]MDV6211812.1 mycofactocin-coupled SDR family oxidoreductase [Rhodococcus erythropolis]